MNITYTDAGVKAIDDDAGTRGIRIFNQATDASGYVTLIFNKARFEDTKALAAMIGKLGLVEIDADEPSGSKVGVYHTDLTGI